MGNFGDKLDDIRIADSTGHEVGYIREESSLISRVYRMPTYRTIFFYTPPSFSGAAHG